MAAHRGTCPGCNRAVVFARRLDDPEVTVVLEPHEEVGGEDRYAVWDDGLARPVATKAEVKAHKIHRCPNPQTASHRP